MTLNGHELQLGHMMGTLLERTEAQIRILESQHDTLQDMKDILTEMPHVLSEKIAAQPQRRGISITDVIAILKALAPVLAFTLAVAGKTAAPDSLPVLRESVHLLKGP